MWAMRELRGAIELDQQIKEKNPSSKTKWIWISGNLIP